MPGQRYPSPPNAEATTEAPTEITADLLVLPVFEGRKPGPGTREVARALHLSLTDLFKSNAFEGKPGDLLSIPTMGGIGSRAIAFVGLGPATDADAVQVRDAAMAAASSPTAAQSSSIASTLGQVGPSTTQSIRAFAEGTMLGRYHYDGVRTKPEPRATLETLIALADRAPARAADALETGVIHADAANWVRDLVMESSSECTPERLAAVARDIAEEGGLDCTIWDETKLEKGRFGGIMGVSRGGTNPPRLIELSYRGAGRQTPIAISGKGITFDSGGLDIKRATDMEWMKADMAGAAAALAVMRALPKLGLRVNVIAAIPSAENLMSGTATRPGDVLVHRNGSTSEVMDTDAEGRLILADALAYLSEKKPRAIIESATLTSTGLGEDVWAIMGTDQPLVDALRKAGDSAGEAGWQIPLVDAYSRHTDSEVADIKNAAWEGADTLASGIFLRHFVGKNIPWAHLDVGDTAFLEFERGTWPTGPTGCPTRVFLRYLEAEASHR